MKKNFEKLERIMQAHREGIIFLVFLVLANIILLCIKVPEKNPLFFLMILMIQNIILLDFLIELIDLKEMRQALT